MKLILKNITLSFLVLFVLFSSLRISFSKITCPIGERFVYESEMPKDEKIVNEW